MGWLYWGNEQEITILYISLFQEEEGMHAWEMGTCASVHMWIILGKDTKSLPSLLYTFFFNHLIFWDRVSHWIWSLLFLLDCQVG